jgi:hypothetical protein
MKGKQKETSQVKHLFKSIYCWGCQQVKSCGQLDRQKKYCCPCKVKGMKSLEADNLLADNYQALLNHYRQGGIKCACATSAKVRVKYFYSDGEGFISCEQCAKVIRGAGKHGVIKNRNDPRFWGLEVKERVLCGFCLGNLLEEMPRRKKYLFWEYGKRGYWG